MARITDKNYLDLETLIEFTRRGVALNYEKFLSGTPSQTVMDRLLDSLEPAVLQDDQNGDLLRDKNFLFCEPLVIARDDTTCPSCVPDPNAFVPDWRPAPDGLVFFDKKRCFYSVVVVAPDLLDRQVTISRDLVIRNYVEAGVQRLIEFHNRTEIIITEVPRKSR